MLSLRFSVVAASFVGAALLACSAPTEPSPHAARFASLGEAPEWTLGAARESAFAAEFGSNRWLSGFWAGGYRVARASDRWATLWDTVEAYAAPKRVAPAVDFAQEMVVLGAFGAQATGGYSIQIVHVTRQRDTTFVLLRTTEPGSDCATPQAMTSPVDARVVPFAPPPTWFLVERTVFDCRTMRARPVW